MIISHPKIRVMAMPEIIGTKSAKSPARINKTLRAMDQLIAFGAREAMLDEDVLIEVLQKM
jgi:hypothetical protein